MASPGDRDIVGSLSSEGSRRERGMAKRSKRVVERDLRQKTLFFSALGQPYS